MATNQLSQTSQFNQSMRDPSIIVLEQTHLSEPTCAILRSYLRNIRRASGIIDKFDEMEQNEQIVSEIHFLCEHNYLFFLVISGRFDLIREIFTDSRQMAKELALVDEIEKELQHSTHQQQAAMNLPKVPLKAPTESLTFPVDPAATLSSWDLFAYYEKEIQSIHLNHYQKRSQIYQINLQLRLEILQRVVFFMQMDPMIDVTYKSEVVAQIEHYERLREEMTALLNQKQDGAIDLEAAKKQHESMRKIDREFAQFFEKIAQHVGTNQEIHTLLKEANHIVQQSVEQLAQVDRETAHQMAETTDHLERNRKVAKSEVNQDLEAVFKIVDQCPIKRLKADQRSKLALVMGRLKMDREQLKSIDKSEQAHKLMTNMASQLRTIESIVNPIVPEGSKITLGKALASLAKSTHSLANLEAPKIEAEPKPPKHPKRVNGKKQDSSISKISIENISMFRHKVGQTKAGEVDVVLDEEQRELAKSSIGKIVRVLNRLKKQADLTEDDKQQIKKIEKSCESIRSSAQSSSEIHLSQIVQLKDALESVSNHKNDFDESHVTLKQMVDSINSSLIPKASF